MIELLLALYNYKYKVNSKPTLLNIKMSKLVRAGIIALATMHHHYSVRAITLRTLLENQIAAETNL